MILIQNYLNRIEITGHAGAAPHGMSVPCEAVTVLANNVVASIIELTNDQPDYVLESGNFRLMKKDLSAESGMLVRSFLVGLQMVAEAYPEYISYSDISDHDQAFMS